MDIGKNYCIFSGIEFYGLQFDNLYMGEKYIAPTPPAPESSTHRLLFNQTEEEIGYNETYLLNTTQTEKSYYYVPFIPGFDQT